jgi:hypothetical protein
MYINLHLFFIDGTFLTLYKSKFDLLSYGLLFQGYFIIFRTKEAQMNWDVHGEES